MIYIILYDLQKIYTFMCIQLKISIYIIRTYCYIIIIEAYYNCTKYKSTTHILYII